MLGKGNFYLIKKPVILHIPLFYYAPITGCTELNTHLKKKNLKQ